MTHNDVSLFVKERYWIYFAHEFNFTDQLFLAIPDFNKSIFITGYNHALAEESINASDPILMLISFISDHLTKIAFLIIPKEKLRVTTGEAEQQEIRLAHDHLEYFSMKVYFHFDHFSSDALFLLLLETPDLKDELCADR